ncbi:phasin family protein [Belnapia sp. T18]|uniref:Phasin family protein n=1 Tax=Belnapia arida TaxID=2804533 RepID=A0ABS1UB50_9PROT|nr:phasin family protein [Belnapia arida]MBL6081906.1 phasin family protein [Belnapia arida]
MVDINKPQDARAAAVTDAAIRRAADAVQQSGHATGEALRQNAEVGADVARRGTDAGAESARRGAELANDTARRSTQAMADAQRQIAQDAAQRFEEVSRKVAEAARGTTENVRQLMALPNAAEGGLRDLQQGMAGLVEGVVQTNLRAAQELFRLANPAPIMELQQRFMREYTDTLLRNSATLVRATRRTADETLRPLEEKIRQADQGQQRSQAAAE